MDDMEEEIGANEADDKSLSSDIDGSCESVSGPQLCHDVILELANYLDPTTIKSARLVSSTWNKGLETQFRRKLMLKAGFNYENSIKGFISVFSPDATTPNAIWIQKPKFLTHELMTKWLESYGCQLTTIKLGKKMELSKHLFSLDAVASILTRFCPNLKILKIIAPFLSENSLAKSINPDPKDVKVALDYLEIGHEECYESDFNFTTALLLSIFKCIKSLKSVKINGIQKSNLHDENGIPQEKLPGDDYAKQVFENIEELDLDCGNINPRRWFDHSSTELQFHNLQKLKIGCFCTCQEGYPMEYLPNLLTSIKDHLKELVLYRCYAESNEERFVCPSLQRLFLSSMPKLEVFKILDILDWEDASLKFLEKLPVLKELHITADEILDDDEFSCRTVENLFSVNKSTERIVHETMERLTFMSYSKSSKQLDNIRICFPNLKKLEVNFRGTPVFSMFWLFKKLKELTIHLFQPFDSSLDSCDFEGISGSVIEKLFLEQEYTQYKRPIRLSSIVDGCVASSSLKELTLKSMKISRKEYEFSMGMLNMAKLKMCLVNCKIDEVV